MAVLRRRKDHGNRFELDYLDIDKRRYRVDTGTTDKKIATLWLRKVEDLLSQAKLGLVPKVGKLTAEVVAGKQVEIEQPSTLEEFKGRYLERCKNDYDLAPKTITTNRLAFDSLISAIGNKGIEEVTDEDIVAWKTVMDKKGQSKTTTGIYYRHLKAAFNRALKRKLVSSNPFLLVSEPKEKKKTRQSKDLSYAEVRKILNAIEEAGDYHFADYIRFLLLTGCRRNEILQITWENIDLDQRKLTIYAEKSKQEMDIPINKALFNVIQEMEIQDKGYVFPTQSTGRGVKKGQQPYSKDYVTHHFKAYIRTLGLPERFSLHSLRHTYTTHLRKKGVPLDIIFRLLGHSSPAVTSENYDHSIAMHFREQADLVDFEGEKDVDMDA